MLLEESIFNILYLKGALYFGDVLCLLCVMGGRGEMV